MICHELAQSDIICNIKHYYIHYNNNNIKKLSLGFHTNLTQHDEMTC